MQIWKAISVCLSLFFAGQALAAPQVIYKGTNVTDLVEGQNIVFSIIASDSGGSEKLVGVVLVDPTSGGTYGTFGVAAEKGSYQLNLPYEDLEKVRPQEPISSPGELRTFVGRVFNSNGEFTDAEFKVRLVSDLNWDSISSDIMDDAWFKDLEEVSWVNHYAQKDLFTGFRRVTAQFYNGDTSFNNGRHSWSETGNTMDKIETFCRKVNGSFEFIDSYKTNSCKFNIRCIERANKTECFGGHRK